MINKKLKFLKSLRNVVLIQRHFYSDFSDKTQRFNKALSENIEKFEKINGEIKSNEPPSIPLNFGPTAEA